jgi:hypothetical protein
MQQQQQQQQQQLRRSLPLAPTQQRAPHDQSAEACRRAQQQRPERRDVLLAGGLACLAPLLAPLGRAQASVPEVAAAGVWGLPFVVTQAPEPIRFPRKTLNLRLAVLLMVSC